MTTSTMLYRVFVYGTLKRGFSNHDRFCRGITSIEEGMVRGRLYALSATIPALEIPASEILTVGTRNYQQDAITLADMQVERPPLSSDGDSGDWRMIHGEVMTFLEPERLACLDRLEGFRPEGVSLYRRVLAPVTLVTGQLIAAWAYVRGDLEGYQLELLDTDNWGNNLAPV
ncbi:MAG: gamma-glutamylcyclotransferase family protein [Armatimonadota bacterium]